MTDPGASILAKLKNKAKATNTSYQQTLQLFFQEEFLRRLARSSHAENFILKGGLFICILTGFQSRATIDIDFMMHHIDNSPAHMDKIIAEILTTPTGLNDVLILDADRFTPIAVQRKYHGVSCLITGHIKKVRVPFGVDIGAGDVIVPKPEKRIIQTQLAGYDAPEIYTYSLESTIAEKFDAILQRFELTGRMKDFYDIFYLACTFNFAGESLRLALKATLRNRKTEYNADSFWRILQLANNNDIQVRWRNFQKNINQTGISLPDVMYLIDIFLRPVFDGVISGREISAQWSAKQRSWIF